MEEIQPEEGEFDAKCKILFAVGTLALGTGLVLTLATRFIPEYYALFASGLVIGLIAWVVCLRETTLVGHDEDAPAEAVPQDEKDESQK